jgi:predicted RNA-binding Zn ribbon-like protein
MVFAHDTEAALACATALVNTLGAVDGIDRLADMAALDEFVATQGWTGSRTRDEAELQSVRALRPRLRRLWEADVDEIVALVNAMLSEANALPQLVRLRICGADDCGNVVVDLSKNRSKRFCDNGCGNRVAVTAYRARKAAAGS